MDETSLFCPYCGKNVSDESEIPKNMEELNDKTSVGKEFMDLDTSSEIIKFYIPDNLQYAIFNGASILGSLPSFQSLFVTYEEFQVNPGLLYKDISGIFSV